MVVCSRRLYVGEQGGIVKHIVVFLQKFLHTKNLLRCEVVETHFQSYPFVVCCGIFKPS